MPGLSPVTRFLPHRDPKTGRFLPSGETGWDDIEVATFQGHVGVQAADLTGGTGFNGGDQERFEGLQLLDYDDFVDRNEELILLSAEHHLNVYANSTETADGTVRLTVTVSASPSVSTGLATSITTDAVDNNVVGGADADDSIDHIGRLLIATGHAPFSDGATGVGGAGSAGEDTYRSTVFPAEFGRFHPRDELFLNGIFEVWNIDDAGIHGELYGQHVYGVIAED